MYLARYKYRTDASVLAIRVLLYSSVLTRLSTGYEPCVALTPYPYPFPFPSPNPIPIPIPLFRSRSRSLSEFVLVSRS